MDASISVLDELMGFNTNKETLLKRCRANNSSSLLDSIMESENILYARDKICSNIELFKDIVAGLDAKIQTQTESINFLRREVENKGDTINKLLNIITNGGHIRVHTKKESDDSDSEYNANVSDYNGEVSYYNQRTENICSSTLNNDPADSYVVADNYSNSRNSSDPDISTCMESIVDDKIRNTEVRNNKRRDKLVDYDETLNSNETIDTCQKNYESLNIQFENYKKAQKEIYDFKKAVTESTNNPNFVSCSTPSGSNFDTPDYNVWSTFTSDNGRYKFADQFKWEKHSTGIASQIIGKMGYRGKGFGLGKFENGIEEAIKFSGPSRFEEAEKNVNNYKKRESICILSGSMLNRLDEKRLSNDHFDVKIRCHGGCTINCLYSHLPWAFKLLPDHIIIHVGTNDCTNKISDEVIKELFDVKVHILKVLPSCKVWLSLPLVRTDNKVANAVIGVLNTKIKKQCDMIIDNSNINERHLSRKGLHLNDHGTKLMARNIISHIKRL